MRDLARQWLDLKEVKQKQRLQRLVLPQGITYDKLTKSFGTPFLSPVFTLSRDFDGDESHLVAGTRIALMPQGYEPCEVLLLHPAEKTQTIITRFKFFQRNRFYFSSHQYIVRYDPYFLKILDTFQRLKPLYVY